LSDIFFLQDYYFADRKIVLASPHLELLQEQYTQAKENNEPVLFPYWAKVWPAAIGLCNFITTHQHLVANKKVVELAGGLGLPSLVVSYYASSVYCTDYAVDCMPFIKKSIELNNCSNITNALVDWNAIPNDMEAEVLLMSDVNYEPDQFEILYRMFQYLLQKGTTILISTPQRLMAKPFIEKLLVLCIQQEVYEIDKGFVTVMVLKGLTK
jgi:predicted nicotinamide N-methyase